MNCKECGAYIDAIIEGKQLCVSCWAYGDDEMLDYDRAIQEFGEDQKTESKCPDCGTMSTPLEWKWDVEDMIMDCPNCGMWRLFAQEMGRRPADPEHDRRLAQYEHEQYELAKIYHTEEVADTW